MGNAIFANFLAGMAGSNFVSRCDMITWIWELSK